MVLRKFFNNATGGLLTALTSNNNTNSEEIQQLEAMGFPRERIVHALNAADNNVERAAELLLLGVSEADYPTSTAAAATAANGHNARDNNDNGNGGTHVAAHNEDQMRRAIEESLQVNQRQEANNLRRAEVASLQNNKKAQPDRFGTGPARQHSARQLLLFFFYQPASRYCTLTLSEPRRSYPVTDCLKNSFIISVLTCSYVSFASHLHSLTHKYKARSI